MRAWFIQGERGDESDTLGCLLRQWASRSDSGSWCVDCLRWTPDLAVLVKARQPDVLLVADAAFPVDSRLSDVLAVGVGFIVAAPLERAEFYRPWAEQHALQLTPLPANVESIGTAVVNVLANLRRQRAWQARIDQLQQRLNDRILIERAKGILVERLSISEKEAYQRLRLQSRRQRRPIRDIAQCLLDAQSLFSPELHDLEALSQRNGQTAIDRTFDDPGEVKPCKPSPP